MATKSKNKKTNNNKKSSSPVKHVAKKERGVVLTVALVIMVLHGLVAAYMYSTLDTSPDINRPYLISLMVIHFLANVAAAAGIYYWKKWGLYAYAGSSIIALVVGLLAFGMWSIYYMILPLVILGFILRSKWNYFE
jgi:hypothetical protein